MPIEERIFLEMKEAGGSFGIAGHMYLVKRSVLVENGVVLSNDYNPVDDQIVRGSFGTLLGTYVGALGDAASLDAYGSGETPETRHSVDITAIIRGDVAAQWTNFQAWARGGGTERTLRNRTRSARRLR